MKINVTKFDEEEIVGLVNAECPDFGMIPESEQFAMALYSMGNSMASISAVTGRSSEGLQRAIDRYGSLTSQLPDGAKIALYLRQLFNAAGSLVTVVSDRDALSKLTPVEATKMLKEIPAIMSDYIKMEETYQLHKNEMNKLNFTGLQRS